MGLGLPHTLMEDTRMDRKCLVNRLAPTIYRILQQVNGSILSFLSLYLASSKPLKLGCWEIKHGDCPRSEALTIGQWWFKHKETQRLYRTSEMEFMLVRWVCLNTGYGTPKFTCEASLVLLACCHAWGQSYIPLYTPFSDKPEVGEISQRYVIKSP